MKHYTALEYLCIALANHYGKDKESFENRIAWAQQNWDKVSVYDAEEPAEFLAAKLAMRDTLAGKPTGFMISLDATSSGPQLLSLLLGDPNGAIITNAIVGKAGPVRKDCYTLVYEEYKKLAGSNACNSRSDVKKCVMQRCYGGKAMVKSIFGDNAPLFEQAMKNSMKYTYWAIEELLWQHEHNGADRTGYNWVMPDGFNVGIKIEKTISHQFVYKEETIKFYSKEETADKHYKGLPANITHSVDSLVMREMLNRCMYNPNIKHFLDFKANVVPELPLEDYKSRQVYRLINLYHDSGFLSSRVLDFINKKNLRTLGIADVEAIKDLIKSLPAKPFKIMGIHDSYHCHCNYANDLREQYKNLLVGVAKSNLMDFIYQQLDLDKSVIFKFRDLSQYAEKEEYAIC